MPFVPQDHKSSSSIAENILTIRNKIREYELRYHRKPHSVSLLAVSKNQSVEKIQEALTVGQTAFGENYLQESLAKIAALSDKNIEWHFIGSIQSNKTKKIAMHFSWVHTVSDIKIATRLNEQRPSSLPPINICLQIKPDMAFENILQLAKHCIALPHLKLRGLMTLPSVKNSLTAQREELRNLHSLYDKLNQHGFNLDTLSMGMSQDMEAAIAEGATIVRIGTGIFGER